MMDYEAEIRRLDAIIERMARLQIFQATAVEDHEARIAESEARWERFEQSMVVIAEKQAEMQIKQAEIDRNMAEITDKLNGLIGYFDGQHKPPAE